jgi:type IV pilus assembly protein PilM
MTEVEGRLLPKDTSDDQLSVIIKEIFAQRKLLKKEVWLNISTYSEDLVVSRVSLPLMPEKEILNAVKWNLKDKLSFDAGAAEFAYEVIGETQKEDGSKAQDIIACAAKRSLLERYLNIFKQAGITLAGINVLPFSISNILRSSLAQLGKTGSVIVCSIDMEHTCLCFYRDAALYFVRQIPLGSTSFINALTGVLASEKGKVELSYEDARKIISETGIPKETQLLAMVRPVIEQFAGEITRSIDYYQREFNADKIGELLIAGEGAGIKGFIEPLSEYLSMKVEPLQLAGGSLFLAAAGAALGHAGSVNLMPVRIKIEKKEALAKSVIRVAAVAVFGTLLLSSLLMNERIKQRQKELGLVKKQRAMLSELKDMRDKIVSREAAITDIMGKDVPVDIVLKELSNVTPGNVAFSEIWLNQGQRKLRLTGRVSAKPETVQDVLSDFMKALEKTAYIRDANLLNVQRETSEPDEGSSSFEISCTFKN